ncbi:MAG: hypothetical protein JSV08_00960 [Acidobacteriota bacterium]|nr:MAG: hypothetical protein JSV08_00960 [Acidobacteriota bacterium]
MWWCSSRARIAPALAGLALLALAGCGNGEDEALSATIARTISAIQGQDVPALWALRAWPHGEKLSVTPPPEFEEEANGYFVDYELGKRAGEIRFDPWGIAAVRILALGRGTFYRITSIERPRENARFVTMYIPLPYERLDYSAYPRDTVLYFLEKPLGKIYKHVVGSVPEVQRELLAELSLRWALVTDEPAGGEAPGLSPAGWLVLTVEPVLGSERYREMHLAIGGGIEESYDRVFEE